ncbi:CCA tRNA nucleotidyltransferase 1, mitochondrial [Musca vetustissima]|uniref:CCA tRNA nucleotidyltransferase 1, mitochondrial n=1 Tax=Musca vetustissima TaxID=27455 RepID=UPI002AB79B83|nr:CCA tRNA nucleotidyltransferase 1, mitochondrial [Musca vetustissima]
MLIQHSLYLVRNLTKRQLIGIEVVRRHMSAAAAVSQGKSAAATAKQFKLKIQGVPEKMRENPIVKKIDTPEFRSIFTEELKTLVELFKKHNYELRIAGGAVRDILMNIQPKDIDFATTATPDQMKQMFTEENVRMINPKGEKHGTITPRIADKENFEVTTLRIDVRTDGRHAEVQFTTDWQLDANRRDLTINSMFLDFDGTIYDYFYGYEDLQKRRVVFVGDPAVRIQEDYLRILRYFRFYGRIAREANCHDEATLEAIRQNVEGLAHVSGERIWSELQKIVVGNFAEELVLEIIKCGLAPYCGLPNEPNIEEFKRLCSALKDFEKPHYPILIMISLLNSVEDVMKMHERLRLSAFERDMALFITQNRDKVDEEYKELTDYYKLCMQPYIIKDYVEQLLKYKNQKEFYTSLKSCVFPKFPINGHILNERGCPKSKKMATILAQLKTIWAGSNFTISAEQLLEEHLPKILESLNSPTSSPNKKMKTTNN